MLWGGKMLKKFILIFSLLAEHCMMVGHVWDYDANKKYEELFLQLGGDSIGLVVVCMACTIYWIQREPNSAKVRRAQLLIHNYKQQCKPIFLEINSEQDLKDFVARMNDNKNVCIGLRKIVQASYKELQDRYVSKFKPWNWTDDMRQAYKEIQEVDEAFCVLTIMNKYKNFITHSDKMPLKDLVYQFASSFEITHPWYTTAQQIEEDLKEITSLRHEYFSCYGFLQKILSKSLQQIRMTDEFMQEKCLFEYQAHQNKPIHPINFQALTKKQRKFNQKLEFEEVDRDQQERRIDFEQQILQQDLELEEKTRARFS